MSALLEIRGLDASYGSTQVLFGMQFALKPGGALALIGRNGMGKTTTLRSILGLTRITNGSVHFDGVDITAFPPHRIAQCGVAISPEGRQVFPTLSVRENLVATAANFARASDPWTLESVYALFPRLGERASQSAATLSGGEQQMLAIGRALMLNPRLLLLDEATEGLAPRVRAEIWAAIGMLRARGQAIIIVDKAIAHLARFTEHTVVLEKGHVAWQGSSHDFAADPTLAHQYLGV